MNWVIIFIISVFALSVGFRQAEREDKVWAEWLARAALRNQGLTFEEGMRIQELLWVKWQEIK